MSSIGNTRISAMHSTSTDNTASNTKPHLQPQGPGGLANAPAMNTQTSPSLDPNKAAGTYRPEQPATSPSFTTTDASGYPDRMDGLSAYSPPGLAQDLHEHHKHHQVPTETTDLLGHGTTRANYGEEMVNKPTVEVAERLDETRLPKQTVVASYLR
ncbi:hypothetical protein FBU30_003244 [Linnemannia zychae]|nr:hypothetical protein FBU30_003244 [Linnemannia zychae]